MLAPANCAADATCGLENRSYLRSKNWVAPSTGGAGVQAGIVMDPGAVVGLRDRYDQISRAYEAQANLDPSALGQRQFYDQIRGLSAAVYDQVRSYQTRVQLDKLRAALESDPNLSSIREPVTIAAGAVAITQGAPIKLDLGVDSRLVSRTDVIARRGQLDLTTSWISSTVGFVADAPTTRDAYGPIPSDPVQREERYSIAVSRPVSIWGLGTGLSYGGTTSTLSATLSRELITHLTCVVGSSHVLDVSRQAPGSHSGEETLRVMYGLNF